MGENESKQLINRFLELSARAQDRGYWTETEFLTPADQDILFQLHCPVSPLFTGGYVGAERRIAASTFSGKDGIIKRLEAANRNTGERKTVI